MPSPNQIAREALNKMFEVQGTDCEAGGETRKALIQESDDKAVFKFLEEFGLKNDDLIRNCMTEQQYSVVDYRAVSKFGGFWCFQVTAIRILPDEPVSDDTTEDDEEESS